MKLFETLLSKIKNLFKKPVAPETPVTAEATEEKLSFRRLEEKNNVFTVSDKKPYTEDGVLKPKTIDTVFDFAYKMAFSEDGEHRSHRSGGSYQRKNGEIFANTFQGKIAECAACNFFYKIDPSVYPDFSVCPLGEWDTVDLKVNGKEIAVKSTKHFGQLLLLETKDWDENGRYIPNTEKETNTYDFLVLIRLNPSCEDVLKKQRLLYSEHTDRETLHRIISEQKWSYNYAGFITRSDLIYIIKNKYILPQGALLNGSTPMDAENYYVQAIDLRNISKITGLI